MGRAADLLMEPYTTDSQLLGKGIAGHGVSTLHSFQGIFVPSDHYLLSLVPGNRIELFVVHP